MDGFCSSLPCRTQAEFQKTNHTVEDAMQILEACGRRSQQLAVRWSSQTLTQEQSSFSSRHSKLCNFKLFQLEIPAALGRGSSQTPGG